MISIDTRYHGHVIVAEPSIWKCQAPIQAFLHDRRFVWLPHPTLREASPFGVLQSVDHATLAFVVIPLQLEGPPPGLPDHVEGYGLVGDPRTWKAWALCCTFANGQATTANLRCPLLFHPKTRRGGQIILDDPRLPYDYPLTHDGATAVPTAGVDAR